MLHSTFGDPGVGVPGNGSFGAAVLRLTFIRVVGNFEIGQISINVAYLDVLTSTEVIP